MRFGCRRRALRMRLRVLRQGAGGDEGSATVEFVFLGVLLLIPVVYLIITAGQVQAASFAVVGAAESAARSYAAADDPWSAEQQAQESAAVVLTDFGFDPAALQMDVTCSAECLAAGSTVTVEVRLDVPLPLVPALGGVEMAPITVDSLSTQTVERYG